MLLAKVFSVVGLLVLASLLGGCGGAGTDGTGPSQNAVSLGVLKGLQDGNITVNDVDYDTRSATVEDGFGQAVSPDALRLGMWLEVNGNVDEVSGQARALSVRIQPAARGVISAVSRAGSSVTVLQTTAQFELASTLVDGAAGLTSLVPGDVVEVHGPAGAAGLVRATRIERLSTGVDQRRPVELRGRVSALNTAASTLTVGKQPVYYGMANVQLRQALANGQVVRVSALSSPVGGAAWRVERLVSGAALPDKLGFAYAEGLVDDWAAGPTFSLDDLLVNAGNASNSGVVTADGQRVAVIGSLLNGTLTAKSVALIQPGKPTVFVLSGAVSSFQSLADFRVRGVLVDASTAQVNGGAASGLADTRRVKVTGTINGQRLMATRLDFL